MSHPRQVMNGFTRRKPRKVRQTRSFSLAVVAFGMLILSHSTGAQPLAINPSAAPSDIGNPRPEPAEIPAVLEAAGIEFTDGGVKLKR